MNNPVSQAAIFVPYFPSPVSEKNASQTVAVFRPERAINIGTETASGLPGLIAGLAEDKGNIDKAIDIVDRTCSKIIGELDAKMALMNEKQAQRQGAIEDLLLIRNTLGNYKNDHPGQKGAVDLSGIIVTLSEMSPLYAEGKKTMPLVDLITYYKKDHSELALPQVPTTVPFESKASNASLLRRRRCADQCAKIVDKCMIFMLRLIRGLRIVVRRGITSFVTGFLAGFLFGVIAGCRTSNQPGGNNNFGNRID
jgi:hypothetical protein